MGDTSTIVVICVGAALVGACLALSLVAAIVDRLWRKYCFPAADDAAGDDAAGASDADSVDSRPEQIEREEMGGGSAPPPAEDPQHVPYLICAVCGAPALFPDDIAGIDPPPFDWEGEWPPRRPRSSTH